MLFDVIVPKVTFLYAGIHGIIYFLLSANVIRLRTAKKVGLGHDNNPECSLFRAVRIHANFGEFVPFILLLMMMDEMTGRSAMFVHAFGSLLILSRASHYFGITKTHGASSLRVFGAGTTFLLLLMLSFLLIIKGLQ